MKKKILILVILLLTVLSGCTKSNLKEINYKEFEEKIKNKENFILEVIQDGCSHCKDFTPKFESVLKKYKITSYQINLSNLNEKDKANFKEKYFVDGTPTTLFFNKGIENSVMFRIDGNVSEIKIIEKLKENGYIKSED